MPVQPAALELLTALSRVLARWGRWCDVEDAAGLWRLHARELDAGRIRATLHLLEEALGQSDLVPAFESILRGAPSRR